MSANIEKRKNGGRLKGTPNKRTQRFREALEENGFHLEEEFTKLFFASTHDEKIKLLAIVLPYLSPKLKHIEIREEFTQVMPITEPLRVKEIPSLVAMVMDDARQRRKNNATGDE